MSRTALFDAAKAWDAAAVRLVLAEKPALAIATDNGGRVALHLCAKRAYPEHRHEAAAGTATVRAFLEGGTPFDIVHAIPEDGETFPATPLWYAVAHGRNPVMTRLLLDLGARPDHCLFGAVWYDEADILQMLLDAGAPVDPMVEGATPLVYAARLGRPASIRTLLRAGAAIDVTDRKGRTPYHLARAKKAPPAILELLEK